MKASLVVFGKLIQRFTKSCFMMFCNYNMYWVKTGCKKETKHWCHKFQFEQNLLVHQTRNLHFKGLFEVAFERLKKSTYLVKKNKNTFNGLKSLKMAKKTHLAKA